MFDIICQGHLCFIYVCVVTDVLTDVSLLSGIVVENVCLILFILFVFHLFFLFFHILFLLYDLVLVRKNRIFPL